MNVYEQVKNMTMDEFRNFCFVLYNKGCSDGANHVSDEGWIYCCYPESKVLNPFDEEEMI